MKNSLERRLNLILPRITSNAFLSSEGIGNEIACYIFDYPARFELDVRDHIALMTAKIEKAHKNLKVLHLNLLETVLSYLKKRGLYDKILKMQSAKGDAAVLKALQGPLSAEKVRDFIASEHTLSEYDLVLISGVGSVWPMLRAHGLLNCLHTVMGTTPLLMFYPGSFDGTTLRLFGRIENNAARPGAKPYYRAFMLIPEGSEL